jgi:hypothetical protein
MKPSSQGVVPITDADRTFATNSAAMTPVATHQPPMKRPAKPVAMTNKAKKERAVRTSLLSHNRTYSSCCTQAAVDAVVNLLPIEYRGNDPVMHKSSYVEFLLTTPTAVTKDGGSCDWNTDGCQETVEE